MEEVKPVSEMTNDEFVEYVMKKGLKGWIPLQTYLRLFPEETKVAIETRIKRRHWQRGIHYNTPPGSNMWVNLHAIAEWVVGLEAKAALDRSDAQ